MAPAFNILLKEIGACVLDIGLFHVVSVLVPQRNLAVPVDGDERVLVLDKGLAEGVLVGGGVQDQRVAVGSRHDLLVAEAKI